MDTGRHLQDSSRILIIDGDATARTELSQALTAEGFSVYEASDGQSGLRSLYATHPHLVLLAPALLHVDGWTVLQYIRDVADIPVFLLCDNESWGDRTRAFNQGVQDCISKPIDVEEAVLRIKGAIRRSLHQNEQRLLYDDGILRVDAWIQEVTVNGKSVPVTRREMALLCRLIRTPGQLVTYAELFESLPWFTGDASEEALRALVYRLRRHLEASGAGSWITTHRSVGLRFDVESPPSPRVVASSFRHSAPTGSDARSAPSSVRSPKKRE